MTTNSTDTIKKATNVLFGVSLILFPIMLLAGFLMHPDVTSFEITTTGEQLAEKFWHSGLFHYGHLIVTFAVPVIIAGLVGIMVRLKGRGAWYGFVGGLIAVFGAFILAVDKGSLCLVLSAFDTLPDDQFAQTVPALQAIVNLDGLLWVNRLLALLLVGGVIQAIGLVREKQIALWQGICMIVGLLSLANPDIEIISSIGAVLMMFGYIPVGIKILRSGTVTTDPEVSYTARPALPTTTR